MNIASRKYFNKGTRYKSNNANVINENIAQSEIIFHKNV